MEQLSKVTMGQLKVGLCL